MWHVIRMSALCESKQDYSGHSFAYLQPVKLVPDQYALSQRNEWNKNKAKQSRKPKSKTNKKLSQVRIVFYDLEILIKKKKNGIKVFFLVALPRFKPPH